eukprot:TRINITY_DN1809_c0_g3_i2.p1 TRINITY_DN1809_c0_g3~~TRINITY_DN1809_c0_g3_i2.p1  ORF type:complete len:264 (-),score=19.16 TRINITY_DN1809_c0_g3_i2:71-862(-)
MWRCFNSKNQNTNMEKRLLHEHETNEQTHFNAPSPIPTIPEQPPTETPNQKKFNATPIGIIYEELSIFDGTDEYEYISVTHVVNFLLYYSKLRSRMCVIQTAWEMKRLHLSRNLVLATAAVFVDVLLESLKRSAVRLNQLVKPIIKYPLTNKASFSKYLELLRPNRQLKAIFNNIVRTAKRTEHKTFESKAYSAQSESSERIKQKPLFEHTPIDVPKNLIRQIKNSVLRSNERPKSSGASRGRKICPKLIEGNKRKVLAKLFM